MFNTNQRVVGSSDEPIDGQLSIDDVSAPPDSYQGVDQADANAEPAWREMAWREIEAAARSGHEITADDIRQRVGEPDHPNRWGGLWHAARCAGLIESVGARPSSTPSRHGGLVRVWRGTRKTAA